MVEQVTEKLQMPLGNLAGQTIRVWHVVTLLVIVWAVRRKG